MATPMISTTPTALASQKLYPPLPTKLAIVEAPNASSRPGRQLFDKQIAYSRRTTDSVFILFETGPLPLGGGPNPVWSGDHLAKARDRREWCYQIVADLVTKRGLTAGHSIDLHVTQRYAPYLDQRLTTLGCTCSIPTAHLNFGQKLAWYTNFLQENDPVRES